MNAVVHTCSFSTQELGQGTMSLGLAWAIWRESISIHKHKEKAYKHLLKEHMDLCF